MSMNIMTPDGEFAVPAGWAGQADSELSLESTRPPMNRAVTEALQVIDHDIEQLLGLRASLTGYGFGKICPVNVTDVTKDDGTVCGGFEKNPAVVGSLANRIEATKKDTRYTYSENTAHVSTNWGYIREKNNTVFLNFIVETKAMSSHTSYLIASSPLKPSERVEVQTVTDRGILVTLVLYENGEMYIYPRANMEDKDLIRIQFSYFRNQ